MDELIQQAKKLVEAAKAVENASVGGKWHEMKQIEIPDVPLTYSYDPKLISEEFVGNLHARTMHLQAVTMDYRNYGPPTVSGSGGQYTIQEFREAIGNVEVMLKRV